MTFFQPAVLVPSVVSVLRASEFHEPNAAFHEPTRHQTLSGVSPRGGVAFFEAVELLDACRFLGEVRDFRRRSLHPERRFVVRDGGFNCVAWTGFGKRRTIQFTDK